MATTTPSPAGQFDLDRGAGRPWWKSLPCVQQHSAAALVHEVTLKGSVRSQLETEHKVQQNGGETATFQILVKLLNGRHLVIPVVGDMSIVELSELVHKRSLVLLDAFYLVKEERRLDDGMSLLDEGVASNDTVHMCGWLRVGTPSSSPVHVDWFCVACNRGGCRASRPRCYLCGLLRSESAKVMGGAAPGRRSRKRCGCVSNASEGDAVPG